MARMTGSNGTTGGRQPGVALAWVLRALAAGRRAQRDAAGGWRLAGRPVPAGTIERLVREELAVLDHGEARATELGLARVERLEAPQRPNRWLERAGRVGREPVLRDRLESPLAWLARRRLISGMQLAAGERLRCDWQLAHALPSVTMRWDPVALRRGAPSGGPPEPGPVMLDARRRVEQALAAVGPGLAAVLERVVCAGEGLSVAERAMGWPARAGKVVLGLALDRLAAHYGLEASERTVRGGRLLRRAGTGGER
jgi:hypothetical protein